MVEHIGVGTVEARGLVRAVEVDEEVVTGGGFSHAVVEVDDHLVVAVHEVDLEAFHAHVGIVLADMFHVLVDGGIAHPKHDAHIALGAIVHQFLDVDFGHHLEKVSLFVDGPAFVQNDIFDAVLRGEVDVVLIGIVVDARREVDAIDVPGVPPVPSHLARLDPRDITNTVG